MLAFGERRFAQREIGWLAEHPIELLRLDYPRRAPPLHRLMLSYADHPLQPFES